MSIYLIDPSLSILVVFGSSGDDEYDDDNDDDIDGGGGGDDDDDDNDNDDERGYICIDAMLFDYCIVFYCSCCVQVYLSIHSSYPFIHSSYPSIHLSIYPNYPSILLSTIHPLSVILIYDLPTYLPTYLPSTAIQVWSSNDEDSKYTESWVYEGHDEEVNGLSIHPSGECNVDE